MGCGSSSTHDQQQANNADDKTLNMHDPSKTQEHFFKVLLLGDSGVGKSSILARLDAEMPFNSNHISTVGVDFKTVHLQVKGYNIKLQIWDTAGQERYRSITTAYYRGAHGVVLVFDLTSKKTFEGVQKWFADVSKHSHDKIQLLLVGNKKDLVDARCVTPEEAQALAKKLGNDVKYVETSAKDAVNIKDVFESISWAVLQSNLNPTV